MPRSTIPSSPLPVGCLQVIVKDKWCIALMQCALCNATFERPWADVRRKASLGVLMYCSKKCAMTHRMQLRPDMRAKSREIMRRIGRPGWNKGLHWSDETREKISQGKKGQKLIVQGGNGRVSPTEQLVVAVIPKGFQWGFVVPTKMPKGSGFPSSYKLDFANPTTMVALEVDGFSHSSLKRQIQDRKKEEFLKSLGWSVLRVTNTQVKEWSTTSKLKTRIRSLLKGS